MHARQSLPPEAVRLARRRSGAVTRRDLVTLGVTDQVIKRLVREGDLVPVTHGVLAVGPVIWGTRAWAGLLVGGDGSCLAGAAAAHVWNIADPPDVIEVRTERHRHHRDGYRFVRGTSITIDPGSARTGLPLTPGSARTGLTLTPGSPRTGLTLTPESPRTGLPLTQGLPRTSLPLTAITLASRAASDDDIIHWLTRGIAQGAELDDLVTVARRIPTLRRRRSILALLAQLEPGIESVLEHRYVVLVERGHALPSARRQAEAGRERLDNLYDQWGVVVELDGRLGHTGDGAFRDLRRDNRHAQHGLITLRFGWDDVTGDPCAVAAQVASALHARGWPRPLQPCGRCPRTSSR